MKSNLLRTYSKVYRAALMLLCVVSLFSCVKVDLCMEDNHTHTGDVKIFYHWPEDISEEQRPDSMLALVNRVINTHRIGYVTDAETSIGGRYRFGKVYDDAMVETTPADQQPLKAGAGEYQVFAFNNDITDIHNSTGANGVVDYRFDNLKEFGDGEHISTVSIRDLGIAYVVAVAVLLVAIDDDAKHVEDGIAVAVEATACHGEPATHLSLCPVLVDLLEGEALMAVDGVDEPDVFFEEGGGAHSRFFCLQI